MAIDFPASPTVGQVFIFGTTTYIWDGTKWTSSAANSPFSLGSASTPSITFIGDTNTGIYSPGADQVSITTGGTERLRVDAAGQIEAVSLGTAAAPTYSFTTDPDTGLYSPGANQVAISTNGTGRLFVDSSGNIGLGAATPGQRLVIETTGSNCVAVLNRTDAATLGQLQLASANNANYILNTGTKDLFFSTNSLERLRITSDGKVGLGTTAPQNLLHLRSDANSAVTYLYLMNRTSGASVESRIAFTTSANDLSDDRHAYIGAVTTGAGTNGNNFVIATNPNGNPAQTRVFVSSTGNVGVGTTSPGEQLEVHKASGSAQAWIHSSGGGGILTKLISERSGPFRISAEGGSASGIAFETGNSTTPVERARIDTSGRLLVGTSSGRTVGNTAGSIQIEGVTDTALTITDNSNGSAGDSTWLTLARTRGTAVGGTTAVSNGDWLGNVDFAGHNGSSFNVAARISGQVDGAVSGGGVGDMPGRLVFSTTADGASSPTERMRIDSSGRLLIGTTTGSARTVIEGDLNIKGTVLSGSKYTQSSPLVFTVTVNSGSDVPRMFTLRAAHSNFSGAYGGSGEWVYRMTGAAQGNVAVLRSSTDGTAPTVTVSNVNGTTFTVSVAFTNQQCFADISVLPALTIS